MFQDAPQFVNYVEQLHHWLLYMVRQKFHSSSKVKHGIARNFWRPLYKICSRSGWITNMKIEHFELVFLRLFVSSKDFCTSTIFWTQIEHRIHIRIRNIGFQVRSYILYISLLFNEDHGAASKTEKVRKLLTCCFLIKESGTNFSNYYIGLKFAICLPFLIL